MSSGKRSSTRDVYLIDGLRTPFLKARTKPGAFSAADLSVAAGKPLLLRQPFKPQDIDELILGCAIPSPEEANIGRVVALRLGCGDKVPAWTVQRNCASGLQAIDAAMQDIKTGRADLVLAGGTEAMSRAPFLFPDSMAAFLLQLKSCRTLGQKLKHCLQFRPSMLTPTYSLLRGLNDPIVNLSMGQTAEIIAHRFGIKRRQMDEFSVSSHQNLLSAYDHNLMSEVVPLFDEKGQVILADDGMRRDTDLKSLSRLKPYFDRPFGQVTAGNSSQVTDGACLLILASEEAVKKYQLNARARLTDCEWAALSPAQMGLGPVHAVAPLLQRQALTVNDIDYWEINEAFAGQVLACLKAINDTAYCQTELNLKEALGEINSNHLNVDGGAIAAGHPVGASGARIVLHLLHVLERHEATRGIASICIGGGQGGALLMERLGKAAD